MLEVLSQNLDAIFCISEEQAHVIFNKFSILFGSTKENCKYKVFKGAWKCFSMNPQKFEQLLHNFFGKMCLEVDVFDDKGKRHTMRE